MKAVQPLAHLIKSSKSLLFVFLFFFLFSFKGFSQSLIVPDTILSEIKDVEYNAMRFKIVFPKSYDPNTPSKVLLALSGGNQSFPIVNYCYAAWFRSSYFEDYITILPIAKTGGNLRDYTESEISNLISTLNENLTLKKTDWIIAGTSNGGIATFNFIVTNPKLFSGAIVMPGAITDGLKINKKWSHLKILLAYGENDEKEWISSVETAKNNLSPYVQWIKTYEMKGQEHLIPLDYNIDLVYNNYFKKD